MKKLIEELKRAIWEERLSVSDLCRQTGIPHSTMYRILSGQVPLDCDKALKLAKVLNRRIIISPDGEVIFSRDLFARSSSIREAIRAELEEILKKGLAGEDEEDSGGF
ncbi:MAG: helix-turn-helix domain-containing protein [bacterium]